MGLEFAGFCGFQASPLGQLSGELLLNGAVLEGTMLRILWNVEETSDGIDFERGPPCDYSFAKWESTVFCAYCTVGRKPFTQQHMTCGTLKEATISLGKWLRLCYGLTERLLLFRRKVCRTSWLRSLQQCRTLECMSERRRFVENLGVVTARILALPQTFSLFSVVQVEGHEGLHLQDLRLL